MFFPRLRRRAKWVFLLIAILFGGGFVFFGVGTGVPGSNIGDALFGGGGGGNGDQPSLEEARQRVAENPNEPEAQLELAVALQASGPLTEETAAEAVAAVERYTDLRPEDAEGWLQLAALYTIEANAAQDRALVIQIQAQEQLFGETFGATGTLGAAIGEDPITAALFEQASAGLTEALGAMRTEFQKVASAYVRLTELEPDDPRHFLQLGQAYQFADDDENAIAAYETFLELSPDDALAPTIEAQLGQLRGEAPTIDLDDLEPAESPSEPPITPEDLPQEAPDSG